MQRLGEGVLLWLAGPDHLIGRGKPGRTDLMGRRWKRITQPGNPKKGKVNLFSDCTASHNCVTA